MKGFLAMVGLLVTVVALIVAAVIELLIKLAPLLVAVVCVWALVRMVRARRRRRADDDRLLRLWAQPLEAPAPTPAPLRHRPHLYVVRGGRS